MTKRQANKLPKLDAERERLRYYWLRVSAFPFELPPGEPYVNVTAVTRALSRYDHHKASALAPFLPTDPSHDHAREGRYHIAWMRTALRQAAKLLGVPAGV